MTELKQNGFFQVAVASIAIISAVVAVVFWVTSEVSSLQARLVIIEKQVEDLNEFRYRGDRFTQVEGTNMRDWFQEELKELKLELKNDLNALRIDLRAIKIERLK